MKQSAAKTLGVAALGAAFAAAGAGAANAAPAVPDAGLALDSVSRTLPAENVTQALPATGNLSQTVPVAAEQALAQGQQQVGTGLNSVQPSARKALADGPTTPFAGLLGGMPAQGAPTTQGLPLRGISLSHP